MAALQHQEISVNALQHLHAARIAAEL